MVRRKPLDHASPATFRGCGYTNSQIFAEKQTISNKATEDARKGTFILCLFVHLPWLYFGCGYAAP
jgi:hypothetical protein